MHVPPCSLTYHSQNVVLLVRNRYSRSLRMALFSQADCKWAQLCWKTGISIRLRLRCSPRKLRELPQCAWYKLSHAGKACDWLAPQILHLPYWKTGGVGVTFGKALQREQAICLLRAVPDGEEGVSKWLHSLLKSGALVRVDTLIPKETTALLPRVSWWPPGRVWWWFIFTLVSSPQMRSPSLP